MLDRRVSSNGSLPVQNLRNHSAFVFSLSGSVLLAVLIFTLASVGHSQLPSQPEFDLLITHGHIIDGTGSPWFEGSVAIKGGRIAAVGRLVHPTARRVIDATGLVVSPGFIDLHTHSDFTLLVDGNGQ